MEISDIIDSISIKLHEAFDGSYRNYIDEVPQGFETPAFLIQFLSLEHKQQFGKRWHVSTLFNVQYFPSDGRKDASNHTLRVQQALKEITLLNGNLMRSVSKNSEIVDGNAHNFMNFNFFLQEVEEKVFMESLEQHSRTKG